MGFYLRKSISIGPLRFNLSKSGIGVSIGVTGFRFGISPRGNYVHMGRDGLYYRTTLPSFSAPRQSPSRSLSSSLPELPRETHAPLEEIESADISQIVDSSSRSILHEINQKRSKPLLWPFVALSSIGVLGLGFYLDWPGWLLAIIAVIAVVGIYVIYTRDNLKKTVVLFYGLDSDMEAAYAKLHAAASKIASCAAIWHIEASGKVHDRKYHAGASNLVRRKKTFIRKDQPPYIKTNVETVAIGVGRQTLYFFPDRVLVYDRSGVGAVSYQELRIEVCTNKFIESESIPRDAKIVGSTWKYVNKSGSPDKRFKDNKELPVCQYEEIIFSSQSGLNEIIQLSRCGYGIEFAEAISFLGKNIPKEVVHS